MRLTAKYLLLGLAVMLIQAFPSHADEARLGLIPQPRSMSVGKGSLALKTAITIALDKAASPAERDVADTLASDLGELGFRAAVVKHGGGKGTVLLSLVRDAKMGDEAYRLTVGRQVTVSARTDRGLFWGTRTLLQLLAVGPGVAVPTLSIADEPECGYRALMVDVARSFHSVDFHKRIVKKLAYYKMNTYHIHFSDDQSYTLPSDAYPKLPTPGRSYTKDDLRALSKLAAKYHVTIIPEIDVPGHASTICGAIPGLRCRNGYAGNVICAGSENSYKVLETLMSEAMELLPGPYFHIGADEVNLSGSYAVCSECRSAIEREKLEGPEALYNRFINRLDAFVKGRGRKTIVWEGFHLGTKPEIEKDVIVEEFENSYALPGDLLKAGYGLINASWSPLYLVGSRATSAEEMAKWSPLLFGRGPCPQPLESMLKVEPTKFLKGVSLCSWENEEKAQDSLLFGEGPQIERYAPPEPRLQVIAEKAWAGPPAISR